ncbi:hypothetical protein HY750_00450 [Candidatus Kuenenbacteria bacterium]|nr:hypothetical protein [Candidatus Kuenenbacteria bacterium]
MKIKKIKPKIIKDRLERSCVVCGKKIKIILYTNFSYRGGHYFSNGNKKPKDSNLEYWECPKCYRGA